MIEQSWILGLVGGAMIGTASALLLVLNGRVAGVSGFVGRLLPIGRTSADAPAIAPTAVFIVCLAAAPALVSIFSGKVAISVTDDPVLLIAGGLLVGFGTQLGSGCTSGHGVCGLSRGSLRSFVAVGTFMTVAAVTTGIMRIATGGIQ